MLYDMTVIPTFTPSFAKATATAFPRPLPPPVISAFLPFKFIPFNIYTVCKIKKIKPHK